VEFDGTFSDVELAGDFFVGKIFEERIEDFLFAAAEIGDGIGFEAASLTGKDGVHETGENGTRNPEASGSDERKSANQLVARFGIGKDALHSEAEQRKTVGVLMLFADDDQTGIRMAFQNIREQSASGLPSGMGVDDVNLCFGWFEGAKVRGQRGFQLLGNYFEIGPGQNAFELTENQRMGREQADREFRRIGAFGSHFVKPRENGPCGQEAWGQVFTNCY